MNMGKDFYTQSRTKVKPFKQTLLAAAIVLGSSGALGQMVLEEVVVTATKRAQGLQDVPIAITAVSGEKISDAGITNLEELTLYTPNVNINKGYASANLFIRGVGSGTNAGFEQSVGLYIDGVYSGRGQLSRVPFTMDLERVEVLKGPQGILFGKNSIGGAINVTTAQPTEEFEGYVEAIYEPDHGEQVYTGVVSGPITDGLGGRLAVRYEGMDGWWENKALNEEGPDQDNWYARGSLRWDASDAVDVTFKYEHGDFETAARPSVVYQSDQPLNYLGESPFPIVDDRDKAAYDLSDTDETTTDVLSLSLNWQVGEHTLTSISSYSGYESNQTQNADFSNNAALNRLIDEEYEQYAQEIRLVSPTGQTIEWLAGGYYQYSELDISKTNTELDFALAGPLAVNPLVATLPALPSVFDQESTSWSLFVQSNWNVTDTFRLGAGIRYNEEEKELDKQTFAEGLGSRFGDLTAITLTNSPADGTMLVQDLRSHNFRNVKRDEDKVTWSGNAQWDVGMDTMLYASVSTGYKGGGFDEAYSGAGEVIRQGTFPTGEPLTGVTFDGSDSSILEFDEETVLAYELGAKMGLLDGAAELNLAVFRMEYDDLQVSSLVGDAYRVGNAGESVSQGVEADGRWLLTESLTLSGSVAYLDAEYDEFFPATCTVPQATDPANNPGCLNDDGSNIVAGEIGGQNLSGETLLFAPEFSATLSLGHVFALTDFLELRSNVDMLYSDEYYSALDLDANTKHESSTRYNARIALASSDDKWLIALIGKNLTDETTYVWKNDVTLTASNSYFGVPERPRSIAIQGRYRFD